MKRKYQGTLKIKPCYPGWMTDLTIFLTPILQWPRCDKFKMNKSMVGNEISFFHIEHGPGVYLWIKEVRYYEKKI